MYFSAYVYSRFNVLIQNQPKHTHETKPQRGCRSTHMKEPVSNPINPSRTRTRLVCDGHTRNRKTCLGSVLSCYCERSPAQHGGTSLLVRLALKTVTRWELMKHTFCCHASPATGESLRALADRDSRLQNYTQRSLTGNIFLGEAPGF